MYKRQLLQFQSAEGVFCIFFLQEIYPGQFEPSPCHKFIKLLENQGKLLRNYTQNIDTLEKVAGVERVIECHGKYPDELMCGRTDVSLCMFCCCCCLSSLVVALLMSVCQKRQSTQCL